MSWRPRLLVNIERHSQERARNCESRVAIRHSVDSHSTREIIQFFSICFIDNRPKAKQISELKAILCRRPSSSKSQHILNELQLFNAFLWESSQKTVTVVESTGDESMNQLLLSVEKPFTLDMFLS